MSAEPRVLLEFEEPGVFLRIVEVGGCRRLQILFPHGWDYTDDEDRSETAVAVYDAMRAREVRE